MELKEPKKKKRAFQELRSNLPLQESSVFHANLSAFGTSIADPTEMEMVYRMVNTIMV